ncbi:hypothetical protein [Pseudomaricurvus sp. HS19]|uniref:hypothetical protein n=1 Tax=Pseudomaricurvus sp. HS19 TaxID=2692626 RepID=UPI001371F36F|nr:hypothetical protein [Pseudomaricurvus sp. HS19]MYM63838.1 hypothetical protein [Pseudomaricurvus sp. HS19]
MKVRKLNDYGVSEFSGFIEKSRSGVSQNIPSYLLEDERSSDPLDVTLNLESIKFNSRYDMGVYLNNVLSGVEVRRFVSDPGFWSWLALFWFDQLCPVGKGNIRSPSKEYNYILSKNYNHRPRHALYMTWQLVDRYGEDAKFLLCKDPSTRGELTEQMMARQEFLTSEGVIRLASFLYFDNSTGMFKKGSAARKSPGCVSRYVNWLQQLQITYDLFSISKDDLEKLLPSEFDRFRSA